MATIPTNAKLRWASRRGMLELDLLLERFLDASLGELSDDDRCTLERLLRTPDPELYAYLMDLQSPDDKELSKLVNAIRAIDHPGAL